MTTCPYSPARPEATPSPDPSYHLARIAIAAARSLADDPTVTIDAANCHSIADELAHVLARPGYRRNDILAASPRVIERAGTTRTLIEMLEREEGNDAARLRLARLLLRALEWK